MKITLVFEDKGAQTVYFDMDASVGEGELETNRPTPAAILAMAVKAMFHNGMLARAGQIALEGISKGIPPETYLQEKYKESKK